MSRAVIYIRVSTKEQVHNYSLDSQERACREYCEQQGLPVDRVFREEGESAKTADRTQLRNLIDFCTKKKNSITHVVVYHLDRFARDVLDHKQVRLMLLKSGVVLRSVTAPIDETPEGGLTENLLSAIAEFDNKLRARRTVVGMQAAMKNGNWPFQTPLGYLKRGDRRAVLIEPDPVRAPLIRHAFDLYASGLHTKEEVRRAVTALGLQTLRGKKIGAQAFHRMLQNRFYAGWLCSPKWKITERGLFQPLISEEQFGRVQLILKGKAVTATPHRRNHPDFPLRGFVRCAACGRPLTGSKSKGRSQRYPYYFCPPATKCKAPRVKTAELEAQFIGILEQLRPKPEYLKLFHATIIEVWNEENAQAVQLAAARERRVRELKEKRSRLVDLFLERKIKEATFEVEQERIDQDIVVAEIEANESRLDQLDVETALAFAEYVLTNAARLWREADLDQRQRLQRVLFPSGAVLKDGKVSTPVICSIYSWLGANEGQNANLASPTGFEPVLAP
jgi:site-specific DNA recombinase